MTEATPPPQEEVDKSKWLYNLIKPHLSETQQKDEILKDKAFVLAPMVDQSDLPFRLLTRKYGVNLAFTPMIHSKMFMTRKSYRKAFMVQNHTADRPLVAQFCGSDVDTLIQAAKVIEPFVDAIDLNCGCPQNIAKRGHYGAFLLEDEETLLRVVEELVKAVNIPVTVKVRLLPVEDKVERVKSSIRLYKKIVAAGASMLTIHGRTRHEKGQDTCAPDWLAIKEVVDTFKGVIPIIANGGIETLDDVRECLRVTGAAGVMSSEGILEFPSIFTETNTGRTKYQRVGPGRLELAKEYLKLAECYPPNEGGQGSGIKCVKMHMHRILHADLQRHTNLRQKVAFSKAFEDLWDVLSLLTVYHHENNHNPTNESLSWYLRHRVLDEKTGIMVQKATLLRSIDNPVTPYNADNAAKKKAKTTSSSEEETENIKASSPCREEKRCGLPPSELFDGPNKNKTNGDD